MPALQPRYDDYECWYEGNRQYCRRSPWNDWVRWVVLAVIIVGFFLLFVLCSCITARRRRKAGRTPFYGTGWAARPGQYNAQPYYGNNNNNYQNPPPQYSAQPQNNGYYGGANQGYYGQQNGVELQPPQAAYAPPAGAPPVKNDGVVR